MRENIASRLDTNTPLIKDLISDIKKGEIKIPQFQRPFVWKDKQAIDLLDSIANNYPLGSLLFWRTNQKLATERNIGDFTLPETDDLSPTNYVLDGQQRLTVIYSCFGATEQERGFDVVYDLEKEEFVKKSNTHRTHLFPLRWIFITSELLNFRTELNSHPQAVVLQSRLDNLIDILTNYRIPVVTLKDLTVEEVCPIFERINSSGTPLSTFDLMVAATWTQNFDLNKEVQVISDSLAAKGYEEIKGDTILKCLSSIHYTSTKKDNILSLRRLDRNAMDSLVEKTKIALLKTVDLLTTEFNLYSWDFLPYEALLVIICFIFSRTKTLSSAAVVRVRKWMWTSSFTTRYRGASDSFLSNDLQHIENYIIHSIDTGDLFTKLPSENELRGLQFRSNSSITRAYILLLASCAPKNLTNGARIDVTEALSIFNKKQFHHIYPQAFLKNEGLNNEKINVVGNICMLAASENIRIRDDNPHNYLPGYIKELGDKYTDVFQSNLLPSISAEAFKVMTYDDFVRERTQLIHQRMTLLCSGEV